MADQITLPLQLLDDNGSPVVATGNVEFFDTGTSTPRNFFAEAALSTNLGSTMDTEAGGRFEHNPVFVSSGTGVKVVFKDASGTVLETIETYPITSVSSSAAADTTFSPITGNAATDVQTAIANNTAAITSEDNTRWLTSNEVTVSTDSFYDVDRGVGSDLVPVAGQRLRVTVHNSPQTDNAVYIRFTDGTSNGDYKEVRLLTGGVAKSPVGPVTTNGIRWAQSSQPDMVFDGTYWVLEETIPVGTGGGRLVQYDPSGRYPLALSQAALYTEAASSGTGAGNSTAATWHKRTVTEDYNDIEGLSVSSGVLTFAAGTYDVEFWSTGYRCDWVRTRLRDTTNSVTLGLGSTMMSEQASGVEDSVISAGSARFTLAGSADVEIQTYTTQAQTDGLGLASTSGEDELYAMLKIERVA